MSKKKTIFLVLKCIAVGALQVRLTLTASTVQQRYHFAALLQPDNDIFCTFMIYVVITLHWYRAAGVTMRSPACVANDNVFTPACTDTIDTLLCCAILHTDILSPCVLCNATALLRVDGT